MEAGGVRYRYDAENQRIEVDGTRYVVNSRPALSQVLVQEENGIRTFYVYGLGLIGEERNGEYRAYHFDVRGSTVALSDEKGEVVERFGYGPYGELVSGNGARTPFLFNGQFGVMSDGNGLYYMRARYYSSEIKRFVNRDVVVGRVEEGQSLNRFAYGRGNPISYIDPEGKWVWWVVGIGVWITAEIVVPSFLPSEVPFESGEVIPSSLPEIVPITIVGGSKVINKLFAKTSICNGIADGWKSLPGGVRIKKVGNYWVKEVDLNASKFAQWWGKGSIDAQARGLDKLGDMAPSFLYKNGKLIIHDVGKYGGNNFWSIWWEGSKRLRTPFNDIRPRNIGANGLIFDPSKHSVQEGMEWFATIVTPPALAYWWYSDKN